MKHHVDLVMPCWDNLEYTKQAVESLITRTDYDKTPYHLILVDNGSKDETPKYFEELKSHYPDRIKVITNQKNEGWVTAVNQGTQAMCPDAKFFCPINNDILFTQDDTLLSLAEAIDGKEWLAGAGPTSNIVTGRQNITCNNPKVLSEEVPWIIGFFFFLKRKHVEALIKKDGFFMDPIYSPGGFDEIDVCYRLSKEGYRFLIDRTKYVHHFCSKSLSRLTSDLDTFHKEKVDIAVKKWGPAVIRDFWNMAVQRVLIGVPTYGLINHKFLMTLVSLEKPEGVAIDTIARSLPDIARNKLASEAMDLGFDYLFYLDDDMIFNQTNLLMKFMDIMKKDPSIDIISPIAYMRNAPFYPCVFTKSAEPPYYHLVHERKKGILEVDATTCAATLVRTSLFRRMEEKLGHRRFFDWLVNGTERMGEDISFCYRAKEVCGAKIVVDSDEEIGHLSDQLIVTHATYERYHSAPNVKQPIKF